MNKGSIFSQALAGERACYNTVQSYGNQVVLLGVKSCHVVSIRSWIERLDSLVDKVRQNINEKFFHSYSE